MANFLELVKMTCASAPGTGTTISLAGAATVSGITYLTLAQAGAVGGTQYDYSLLDPTNGGCETGTITMPASGLVMTGRTVYKSSNGNAAINASSDAIFSISGLTTTFNDAALIKTGTLDQARLPAASTSAKGAVQLATTSDENAGTSSTLAVTPAVQQAHPSAGKAWVDFNGTGTVAIKALFNVSSITDNGIGLYTINIATALLMQTTLLFLVLAERGRRGLFEH